MFSKAGPNLIRPEETRIPSVIPNMCKLINNTNKIIPKSYIDPKVV